MGIETKILRLDLKKHSLNNPILVNIFKKDTGVNIIEPIDLIKTLLSIKEENGNYVYQTQMQLDINDIYKIDIEFTGNETNAAVEVKVNGYKVNFVGQDL